MLEGKSISIVVYTSDSFNKDLNSVCGYSQADKKEYNVLVPKTSSIYPGTVFSCIIEKEASHCVYAKPDSIRFVENQMVEIDNNKIKLISNIVFNIEFEDLNNKDYAWSYEYEKVYIPEKYNIERDVVYTARIVRDITLDKKGGKFRIEDIPKLATKTAKTEHILEDFRGELDALKKENSRKQLNNFQPMGRSGFNKPRSNNNGNNMRLNPYTMTTEDHQLMTSRAHNECTFLVVEMNKSKGEGVAWGQYCKLIHMPTLFINKTQDEVEIGCWYRGVVKYKPKRCRDAFNGFAVERIEEKAPTDPPCFYDYHETNIMMEETLELDQNLNDRIVFDNYSVYVYNKFLGYVTMRRQDYENLQNQYVRVKVGYNKTRNNYSSCWVFCHVIRIMASRNEITTKFSPIGLDNIELYRPPEVSDEEDEDDDDDEFNEMSDRSTPLNRFHPDMSQSSTSTPLPRGDISRDVVVTEAIIVLVSLDGEQAIAYSNETQACFIDNYRLDKRNFGVGYWVAFRARPSKERRGDCDYEAYRESLTIIDPLLRTRITTDRIVYISTIVRRKNPRRNTVFSEDVGEIVVEDDEVTYEPTGGYFKLEKDDTRKYHAWVKYYYNDPTATYYWVLVGIRGLEKDITNQPSLTYDEDQEDEVARIKRAQHERSHSDTYSSMNSTHMTNRGFTPEQPSRRTIAVDAEDLQKLWKMKARLAIKQEDFELFQRLDDVIQLSYMDR